MDEYKRRRRRSRAVMSMFLDSLGGSIDNVDVATFDSDGTDLKALVVGIEPIQDLHGYDNPWPAGGGKNLIDDTATADFSVELPAGTYYVKRFRIGSESTHINSRLSANINGTDTYILPGTYDDGDLVATGDLGWGESPEQTIVTTKTYTFTLFLAVINGYRGKANMIMQTGSMPTAYSPYSNICPITGHSSVNVIVSPTLNPLDGTITNIPLGTTVYGGTLDVLTGVLTVDRAMVDLGTLAWGIAGTDRDLYSSTGLNGIIKPAAWSSEIVDAICSIYTAQIGTLVYQKKYDSSFGVDGNGRLYIYDSTKVGLSVTDFKTAMSGVQLVYELATPQTIQLTGQQISTFLGTNNVWCDSGKIIHLEY